ncbi:MAG: acyltransferase [Hyphomonadaceae bacterium]|nr:acyltransferase [Hyphomonadaceae bacterium]
MTTLTLTPEVRTAPAAPTQPAPSVRRADIDWVRIAAFGLLIVYHVGLVYAPWDWHVNSSHRVEELKYAALIMNPWRLTLLFFISGVAFRLMSRNAAPEQAIWQRLTRLAPPFLFGVLVLVPPQAWLEATAKGTFHEGFVAWWLAAFSPEGIADGVPINHLWFVLYIGVYTLIAAPLLGKPQLVAKLEAALERTLSGWRLIVAPMLYLIVVRQMMLGWFGVTNHLQNDWYNHAASFATFLLGFLIAKREGVWRDFERLRWVFLACALAALPLLMAMTGRTGVVDFYVRQAAFGIVQWGAIGAALGFARNLLKDARGPALTYLSRAIFPCYLAHQTVIVMAAYALKPAGLPLALEAGLLLFATLAGTLLVYEIVRRVPALGPLWGLNNKARS